MASHSGNITPSGNGSFDHVHYYPRWTDPNWQDEAPERHKGVFEIKDNVFDRLRPALLPRDLFLRPTIYAKRFGIFPDRTDGRSRTSPTRAESRRIFPANADIQNGKQLFGRFEELAKAENEHVDDYMERTRPDMQKLDETEQQFMQQYEDLVLDENWQAILFGSLTMDEIQADGYFPMCDADLDGLQGQIYELFKRERWVDNRRYGKTFDQPRFMYTLNGKREEWNPRTNDRVWDAMQPALQLATRILETDDTFIAVLKDITNRLWVDKSLFEKQDGQTRDRKLKFVRELNPHDPTRVPGAKDVNDAGIDATAATWESMLQIFELELFSSFMCGGKLQRDWCAGVTECRTSFVPGNKLNCKIDAELVWPLINDTYTNSEKMMSSLMLASTIAHEMMHAITNIPIKWLANPASVGIVQNRQVWACRKLLSSVHDMINSDLLDEPYFENDPYSEVGNAFESHTAAGLLAVSESFDGDRNHVPHLEFPLLRNIKICHFVRFEDAKKYFTQAFWDVSIEKYGTASLRESSRKPHKITYYPEDDDYELYFDEATLGTDDDKEWLRKFTRSIGSRRKLVLKSYLNNLIMEACKFDFMIQRFKTDQLAWPERDKIWYKLSREALMIICEVSARSYQTSQRQDQKNALECLHNCWKDASAEFNGYADNHSPHPATLSPDVENWARYLQNSGYGVDERLVSRLIDFTRLFEMELSHIESIVCEIYQVGTTSWPLYELFGEGHIDGLRRRVDKMLRTITDILSPCDLVDQGLKRFDAEWFNRLWSLGQRVKDVLRLLNLDTRTYEHSWRDLLLTMPMVRKSNRKPHQRFYFLAKKDMMRLIGYQLEEMKEFKTRFQNLLGLGGYKVPLPGEDPDELSIAQRLSGTLDDDRGNNDHDETIRGPSTGIFDLEGVKNLANRLREEENNVQTDMLNRIANRLQRPTPGLQQEAEAQAGLLPQIPPKFQKLGFENQAVPFSCLNQLDANNAPFAAFSSGTASPFPPHELGQPAAWIANNTKDLAFGVNHRLAGAPPVAHGLTPHPYALRGDLTEDLEKIAQTLLPMRNPATFVNEYPREVAQAQGPPVDGPLGDIAQIWEQQFQHGQNSPPAATGKPPVFQNATGPTRRDSSDADMTSISGGHGARATVLLDFACSSSETDVSDDDARRTGENSSSGTTLVGSPDVEEELFSKILEFERSETIEKGYDLKRKLSWAPFFSSKKKMEKPKAMKGGSGLELRKAKSMAVRRDKERNPLRGMPSRTFRGRVSGLN
ncbi:hypothetical protein FBEOM_4977 [Fusarium beomiforme]|uniref:Uncharacterized protein n=1 Tax=Fusarium beomiforme TaxID=44412 RepID=A0A9P5ANK9_9HYPO|nr:hypothetical protein FBEOM_4977 [Fusarium beomiforme]